MPDLTVREAAATATQPRRIVLTTEETIDDAIASDEFVASDTYVVVADVR